MTRCGLLVALCVLTAAEPVTAAVQQLSAVPTGWRLENYAGDGVVVWYTGAPCGQLHFGSGWSSDDRERLWATVSTGKAAGRAVGVQYDDQSCNILSFYLKEG